MHIRQIKFTTQYAPTPQWSAVMIKTKIHDSPHPHVDMSTSRCFSPTDGQVMPSKTAWRLANPGPAKPERLHGCQILDKASPLIGQSITIFGRFSGWYQSGLAVLSLGT